jgi:anti-anti-sigma regulatory factor
MLSLELNQPYDKKDFELNLDQICTRIYAESENRLTLSLVKVHSISVSEADLLLVFLQKIQLMGYSVEISELRPAVALLLSQTSKYLPILEAVAMPFNYDQSYANT